MSAEPLFAVNAAWGAQAWSIEPGDTPPMGLDADMLQEHVSVGVRADSASPEAAVRPVQAIQPVTAAAEDDPARYRFHAALYAAALRGDVNDVSQILDQMTAAGLPPGPAALHSLVFAHIKAGDATAALQAARGIVSAGMAPLEETYIALVYGLAEESKVELAEGVVMSMYNAGRDTSSGVCPPVELDAAARTTFELNAAASITLSWSLPSSWLHVSIAGLMHPPAQPYSDPHVARLRRQIHVFGWPCRVAGTHEGAIPAGPQ
jgi:hypothetical protein